MNNVNDNALRYLPRWLRGMAQDVGLPAVMHLVRWRGGRRAYVPEEALPEHRLTQVIGTQGAAWLCARFPGDWLDVPRCLSYLLAQRNAQIVEQWLTGDSQSTIAGEHSLTIMRVRQILRSQAVTLDDRQQALFD